MLGNPGLEWGYEDHKVKVQFQLGPPQAENCRQTGTLRKGQNTIKVVPFQGFADKIQAFLEPEVAIGNFMGVIRSISTAEPPAKLILLNDVQVIDFIEVPVYNILIVIVTYIIISRSNFVWSRHKGQIQLLVYYFSERESLPFVN